MTEENPLERMLNELAELFKMVEEGKTKPLNEIVTPELKARLAHAKNLVDKYAELNAQVFKSAGLSEKDINRMIEQPSANLTPKQKKVLEFSKKLKIEVETARIELTATPEVKPMYSKDKQKAEDIAKRKKKFKRMGGTDWMPL